MICGGCLTTAHTALSAEVQPGFYFGIGAGESSYDLEQSMFDDVVRTVLFTQSVPLLSRSSSLEDSDTTLALFAGYHFNQYIAVEAGYIDLGAAEYRTSGTVNPPGPVVSAPFNMNIDVESTGFTVAGRGSLPLGSIVDLHGRLGLFFARTDISVGGQVVGSNGTATESLDSIGGFYGIGAGLNFDEHWSLSFDWTRYDNVGDEDEDDDVTTEAGFDVDALSISAMFRF